ncbi:MAG: DUF4349 domain-containing protein [Planctomycetota bacterium]|nr:DUF4349 domain-containing protein [Planctomycetota bacterium]
MRHSAIGLRSSLFVGVVLALLCGCSGNRYAARESAVADVCLESVAEHESSSSTMARGLVACTTPMPDPAATRIADASVLASPKQDPAQPQRLVIYNGSLALVVESIAITQKKAQELAETAGGYVVKISGAGIVVKIPAAKFIEVADAIAKLGEVTRREIAGSDVTEEMFDIQTRLANAEKMRERLLKLLETTQKTKDALEVEKELGRVTEEIERFKGRIRFLQEGVAYSTLDVQLNSSVPQDQIALEVPFPWVRALGGEVGTGRATETYVSTKARERGVEFTPPQDFIKYFERDYVTRAMSPDGVLLRVQRQENMEGGSCEFWSKLCRRILAERKGFALDHGAEIQSKNRDHKLMLFKGTREVAGVPYGYAVAIAASGDYIYVFEAWGAKEKFDACFPKIEDAARSVYVR